MCYWVAETICFSYFQMLWLWRPFPGAMVAETIFSPFFCCYGCTVETICILISRCYGCRNYLLFLFPGATAAETIFYSYFQVLWLQKLSFILFSRCYGCRNYLLFLFPGATVVEAIPGFSVSHLTRLTLSRAPR